MFPLMMLNIGQKNLIKTIKGVVKQVSRVKRLCLPRLLAHRGLMDFKITWHKC